jgi:hypothetical protein
MFLQQGKYFVNVFDTVCLRDHFIAHCRWRGTINLWNFLLSLYSLIWISNSVQDCTFRDCTCTFYSLLRVQRCCIATQVPTVTVLQSSTISIIKIKGQYIRRWFPTPEPWTTWHCRRFVIWVYSFFSATHHSTIAPYPPITTPKVWDSHYQAVHYHILGV